MTEYGIGEVSPMFDPLDPGFLENPYAAYARLRELAPVARARVHGREVWVVTSYDECVRAFGDPRLKLPSTEGHVPSELGAGPAARILPMLLRVHDPAEPNRLRRLVAHASTASAAEALRPAVAQVVSEALDRAEDKGSMELVSDFAFPVAILSVAELLGVPAEDCSLLRTWAPDASTILEPQRLGARGVRRCHAAVDSLWLYFEEHVRRLRRRPGHDLLSSLAEVRSGEDRLSDEELIAFCVQHLAIGYRCTEALIGNGALAFALHPDQAERLRTDPGLAASAVEECLRWDAPFQIATRVAAEDMGIRGFSIEAGEILLIVLGAANRDPELFDAPDTFDIARSGPPQLSFGMGPRTFVGAAIARMQAQQALQQLVGRFPVLRLASEPPVRRRSILMRALERCPVAFAA
jgi:pimeloyl-[acyl-carrier protein] synthase